jgi:hypothetical protein
MRNTLTLLCLIVLIASFGTLNGISAQEKQPSSPDLPVRNEIHRQYRLTPNTTVKISMIAGPVEIDTTPGESAEINIVNSAETQADLNCADIPIEQTPGKLVIRSKDLCPIVRVNSRVMLKLPRNVNLNLEFIAGHVRIGPTEGMVRLESIAGHVRTGFVQAAEMSSLARGISVDINNLGAHGVRVSNVNGDAYLQLASDLNAQLSISNTTSVSNKIAGLALDKVGDSYSGRVGSGGPRIVVTNVTGTVVLQRM